MDTAMTARRFVEDVLNTGDWSRADEILANDVVMHHPSAPEPIRGRDAVQGFLGMFRAGMPDVAVRWHAHGTHSAEMFGIPATNRGIDIHGISFFRFDDSGKIVEDWVEENTLGVLQQLGVVPALG
jgi:predicted SnoaL-like aldol condensation-catalyzing enzyme